MSGVFLFEDARLLLTHSRGAGTGLTASSAVAAARRPHGPARPPALGTRQLCGAAHGGHFTRQNRQRQCDRVRNVELRSPQRGPIYGMEDGRKASRGGKARGASHAHPDLGVTDTF